MPFNSPYWKKYFFYFLEMLPAFLSFLPNLPNEVRLIILSFFILLPAIINMVVTRALFRKIVKLFKKHYRANVISFLLIAIGLIFYFICKVNTLKWILSSSFFIGSGIPFVIIFERKFFPDPKKSDEKFEIFDILSIILLALGILLFFYIYNNSHTLAWWILATTIGVVILYFILRIGNSSSIVLPPIDVLGILALFIPILGIAQLFWLSYSLEAKLLVLILLLSFGLNIILSRIIGLRNRVVSTYLGFSYLIFIVFLVWTAQV